MSTPADKILKQYTELAPTINKAVTSISPDVVDIVVAKTGVTATNDIISVVKKVTEPDSVHETELMLSHPLAKKIYNEGLELANKNNLNSSNVVNFTLGLMQKVEIESAKDKASKSNSIVSSGSGKKNMVICVVKLIIKAAITDDAQEQLLLTYCDNYLPPIIDVVVSISNGEFNINDIGQVVSGCLPFAKK